MESGRGTPESLHFMLDVVTDEQNKTGEDALVEASPMAIFTLAVEDGSLTSFNPAFEQLTGWSRKQDMNRPMTALVRPGEVANLISHLHQITLGTTPSAFEIGIRSATGRFHTAEITLVPRFEKGRVIQVMGFAQDVSHRKIVVRDLHAAKAAAESASLAKSEFLANMSHEIRTPLNAIVGMTTLLLDMELEDQASVFAETIRTSSQTLLGQINGILDFSKIESGKLELEIQPFGLRDCVDSGLELVTAAAAEKGLDLEATLADGCPEAVYGDITRVRQVLVNLLSNAVKFTERGSIRVTVESESMDNDHHQIRFAVSDTGVGIPAVQQAHIFDAFSQADASTTRRFGGTGLGLSISKRLTELMGGTIGMESQENEGSTFHFSIRARSARRAEPSPETIPIDPDLARKHPLRILVAEDHPINQVVAQLLLERLGYQADLVGNGQEAFDAVQRQAYDIIFMDVHMPVLDGLEATRRICQSIRQKQRPQIVAMTASAMKGDREQCFKAGMIDFVTKPIFIEDLQETLALCAKRKISGNFEPRHLETREEDPLAVASLEELPILDPQALARFQSLDAERVAGFIATFLDTSRQEIERLHTAARGEDAPALVEAAHSLKGSAGIFGALRLQKICFDLERAARKGSTSIEGLGLSRLTDELEEVRQALG